MYSSLITDNCFGSGNPIFFLFLFLFLVFLPFDKGELKLQSLKQPQNQERIKASQIKSKSNQKQVKSKASRIKSKAGQRQGKGRANKNQNQPQRKPNRKQVKQSFCLAASTVPHQLLVGAGGSSLLSRIWYISSFAESQVLRVLCSWGKSNSFHIAWNLGRRVLSIVRWGCV